GSTADTGSELWVSDGSEPGTHLTREALPGAAEGFSALISPPHAIDDRFFCALGPFSFQIWVSDGTQSGTVRLINSIGSATPAMNEFEGNLVVAGSNGVYVSDGTVPGTQRVIDFDFGAFQSALIPGPGVWDGLILLSLSLDPNDSELVLGN